MLTSVTFLTVFLPYQTTTLYTCVPNTNFIRNGRLCLCDNFGNWNEANCNIIQRRFVCNVGHAIRHGCNKCVCQENGQYLCTNAYCLGHQAVTTHSILSSYDPKCTPFRSYYIHCNLCVCPASGFSAAAQCTKDVFCPPNSSDFQIVKHKPCIPNIMYIYPHVQCVCSEKGTFDQDKCVNKCLKTTVKGSRRCIPGTYYRSNCKVCLCPDNGRPDKSLCKKGNCNGNRHPIFQKMINNMTHCTPYMFTKATCLFCDCNLEGTVNDRRCTEIECSQVTRSQYHGARSCSPGEIIPICIQCFCFHNGLTHAKYCTNTCTYPSKLHILESIINETSLGIIHRELKIVKDSKYCLLDAIYLENGRYCLCPENGDKSFKFCTYVTNLNTTITRSSDAKGDFIGANITCEPGTFVEFDCNSCYCPKSGKVDPKWCTFDDCAIKKVIEVAHKSYRIPISTIDTDGSCVPGSISKVQCNFCICPDSGILSERACTKNDCYDFDDKLFDMNQFTCEPLAYYEVDCNICFCPRDGIKNVARCTKNPCEKNFLRSNDCIPSKLFTDVCNVCVCPRNGDKSDRACTMHKCGIASWNGFKLSQGLLQNKINVEKTRNLDLCFPGEEFTVGCKICVCPELGLKMYAFCDDIACKENDRNSTSNSIIMREETNMAESIPHNRVRRFELTECMEYKMYAHPERKRCSPGSMYIVRCQQCFCPYMGNLSDFCRPLPKNMYCEQAFPNFNYLPMGRRIIEGNSSMYVSNSTSNSTVPEEITLQVTHEHTKYECDKVGKIMDQCYICNCEDTLVLIEEHCFKSTADKCKDAKPSFLDENKVITLYNVA